MIVKMLLAYENALGLCEGVEIAIEYRWSQPFSLAKSKIESQKFDCCDGGPNTGSKSRKWPPCLHAFSMKPLMFLDKANMHLIHRLLS